MFIPSLQNIELCILFQVKEEFKYLYNFWKYSICKSFITVTVRQSCQTQLCSILKCNYLDWHLQLNNTVAQSAGVVEYTDCFSAEG